MPAPLSRRQPARVPAAAPAALAPARPGAHSARRAGARPAAPPPAAVAFADAALRRVLEVIDRRRPIAQLRPMLTPPLLDMVFALTTGRRTGQGGGAAPGAAAHRSRR